MPETALVPQLAPPLDPQALIQTAIERGASVETMERLVALAKDVRAVQAREAWYAAMAEFQRVCPRIVKTATAKIQTARATYSYRYAPLDDILSVIQPVMGPLGLSISWRSRVEPEKVVVSCRISHTLGHHEESGEIAMPIVTGDGTGATPPQRVGIAATYAKRYALLGIIGMAPEDDEDAATGAPPAAAQSPADGPAHPGAVVSEPQVKRLSAIASGMKWTDEQLHELLSGYGYNSRTEIRAGDYERIVEKIKAGPNR